MEGKLEAVSYALVRALRYPVRFDPVAWVLPEGPVPQSVPHDEATERLRALLKAWARDLPRPVFVAHDLAIRFSEAHPKVGIDPDLCLLDPPPPNVGQLQSLALWKEGHAPPSLCLEIVSRGHPHKDYRDLPHRYAHVGARELVVFDPLRGGARRDGGPVLLQVWRRSAFGDLELHHFGDDPCLSEVLGAWLHPQEGGHLAICDDHAGLKPWLTGEERERAEKERERAEKERERAEKERERAEKERERAAREDLERRVADLEKMRR